MPGTAAVTAEGVFGTWQPIYAKYGIPTFPVIITEDAKKPAVRGYLKIGLQTSQKLTGRFSLSDAFGFALGPRTKITVLDIDTSDEHVLMEAIARHGETPIIVRSGSGPYQAW